MATFSQRHGFRALPAKMIPETASDDLRNTIWNLIDTTVSSSNYDRLTETLWHRLYKLPVDSRPYDAGYMEVSWIKSWRHIRNRVLNGEWFDFFDHLEFFVEWDPSFEKYFNSILTVELSAYRLIEGQVCQITEENELKEVQAAMNHLDRFAPISEHISTALKLMSDRSKPDFRNSIKESISAVESAAKITLGEPGVDLGKALGILQGQGKINGALKNGFAAIYGWTSNQHGIRHGMIEESGVTQSEAQFFLIICSAFANYLKTLTNEN